MCKMNGILLKFYTSCALSSWGDRCWAFALSMYFIEINKNTLLMNAVNGITCSAAVILFGSMIGALIDKHQRLPTIRISLFVQNITVAITCVIVVCIILFRDSILSIFDGRLIYYLQVIMIIFNVISTLASMTTRISMERDWVIVIAETVCKDQKNSKNELATINAQVRRIDLSLNILAPVFSGTVMTFANLSKNFNGIVISALFLTVWNLISLIFEYSLLRSVYNMVPKLKKPESEDKRLDVLRLVSKPFTGWYTYANQGLICLMGISFAFLFLTLLSFDSITLAYSRNQGLSESALSIIQCIGSVTGVLGTFVYPLLHNRFKMSLYNVGLIGSISQLVFLFFAFLSQWMPGSPFVLYNDRYQYLNNNCTLQPVNDTMTTFLQPCKTYTSIFMFLSGIALSRFGLWLFDLAAHQIIQENVAEKERGVVGGVQRAINQIFDLIKFALVIILPKMDTYGYLVIISMSSIFISFSLFLIYVIVKKCCKKYTEVAQDEEKQIEMEKIQ